LNKFSEIFVAIRLVRDHISRTELKAISGEVYAGMVKVVADIDQGVLGLGGSMHHDIEAALLAQGSNLKSLWGFSLYLGRPWAEAFEFRSHVNVRPLDGNPSIQIHDEKLCKALLALAEERIDWDR
jgi:hypothetical protein